MSTKDIADVEIKLSDVGHVGALYRTPFGRWESIGESAVDVDSHAIRPTKVGNEAAGFVDVDGHRVVMGSGDGQEIGFADVIGIILRATRADAGGAGFADVVGVASRAGSAHSGGYCVADVRGFRAAQAAADASSVGFAEGGGDIARYVLARFTGANGTALSAYTTDSGHTFTVNGPAGGAFLNAGKLRFQAANETRTWVDAGQADCRVSSVHTINNANGITGGVMLRVVNDTTFLLHAADLTSHALDKVTAGGYTVLGSAASGLAYGVPVIFSETLSGASITLSLTGSTPFTYASATQGQTSTLFGFMSRATSTGTRDVDDWEVKP